MKKYILIILSILCILSLVGCSKKEKFEIEITIPAGSAEEFVYSDEEIRPTGNKIKISSGAGLGDTEVILKPVNENVETGYVAEYLTHGAPVKFDTSNVKNEWFKIGVAVQNDSDRGPIAVSVEVEGVEVRISKKAEAVGQDYFNAVVVEVNDDKVLAECIECESGWLFAGCEVSFDTNTLSFEEVPTLEVGDTIRVVYSGGIKETEPLQLNEVVSIFWIDDNGKIVTAPFEKSVEKTEIPNFGITLTAKNVTSKGLTLVCEQSGGETVGELFTGSDYSLSKYTDGNWEEVDYVSQEVAWTSEARIIPNEDTVEWEINWEKIYGELSAGHYRIGKPVMNLIETGKPSDFETAMHFAEFTIGEAEEWTKDEIRSLFESNSDPDWNYIECVAAYDFAFERVGAILYTEQDSEYIKVAFMDDEGYMQHCGIEGVLDAPSEFIYLGNGAVSFKACAKDGTKYTQKITLSIDGANVNFVSETI